LYLALSQLWHNVSDYILGNIEATAAFNGAVDEIYEPVRRSWAYGSIAQLLNFDLI
jgi:hypothetical protein